MKYTNIFEKLICLFNIAKTNWMSLVFIIFVAGFLILLGIKKITKKQCFIFILVGYLCLLTSIIITYNKQLGIIGDNLVNNLFKNIYFPSTYTYLFVLIVIDITTIVTLLNNKSSNVYKWIHGIFFFIIQFILAFILELLSKNKIDIFSKTSLFSNKDLVMMLELSMNIFIIYLVVITFVYITNTITEKIILTKKENISEETIPTNINNLEVSINTKDIEENSIPQNQIQIPVTPSYEQVLTPIESSNENIFTQTTLTNNFSQNTTPSDDTINVVNNNTNTINNTTEILNNLSQKIITPNTLEMDNINTNIEMNQNEELLNTSPTFTLSDLIPQKQEKLIPEPMPSNVFVEPIFNNELSNSQNNEETDNYTLNDYRLFNKMLKEIKEHNQNNTVTIDKDLEYRLITKYSTETYNMFKKMLKIYSN